MPAALRRCQRPTICCTAANPNERPSPTHRARDRHTRGCLSHVQPQRRCDESRQSGAATSAAEVIGPPPTISGPLRRRARAARRAAAPLNSSAKNPGRSQRPAPSPAPPPHRRRQMRHAAHALSLPPPAASSCACGQPSIDTHRLLLFPFPPRTSGPFEHVARPKPRVQAESPNVSQVIARSHFSQLLGVRQQMTSLEAPPQGAHRSPRANRALAARPHAAAIAHCQASTASPRASRCFRRRCGAPRAGSESICSRASRIRLACSGSLCATR